MSPELARLVIALQSVEAFAADLRRADPGATEARIVAIQADVEQAETAWAESVGRKNDLRPSDALATLKWGAREADRARQVGAAGSA